MGNVSSTVVLVGLVMVATLDRRTAYPRFYGCLLRYGNLREQSPSRRFSRHSVGTVVPLRYTSLAPVSTAPVDLII